MGIFGCYNSLPMIRKMFSSFRLLVWMKGSYPVDFGDLKTARARVLRRMLLDLPREKATHVFSNLQQFIQKHTRFAIWFKILVLLPILMWLILFKAYVQIPISVRPTVDLTTLPAIDNFLLFGRTLLKFPREPLHDYPTVLTCLDMLAAFVYLIHFAFAWIVGFLLYLYHRKRVDIKGQPIIEPWTFFLTMGILNLIAVITQISWPTAPPWYIDQYGTQNQANYLTTGDEAGLARVDAIIGFQLFKKLYGQSPIVFGSFPSLHAAWPVAITLFLPDYKWLKAIGVLYCAIVWWAAMYLNHHFFIDVLGGGIFVAFSYFVSTQSIHIISKYMKVKIYARGFKWIVMADRGKDVELVVVNIPTAMGEKEMVTWLSPNVGRQKTPVPTRKNSESVIPLLKEQ
eukprot:TRINITY_DN12403_c0_g1_i1.p1 TRINITY_DN12403_c0_g1~~TRINITY_DN12403_c0_g1_i1.p1  ORF type:complete len:399 (-),score=65.38 TRINITY_DN12403_c0_g1_i1:65-1261(-)